MAGQIGADFLATRAKYEHPVAASFNYDRIMKDALRQLQWKDLYDQRTAYRDRLKQELSNKGALDVAKEGTTRSNYSTDVGYEATMDATAMREEGSKYSTDQARQSALDVAKIGATSRENVATIGANKTTAAKRTPYNTLKKTAAEIASKEVDNGILDPKEYQKRVRELMKELKAGEDEQAGEMSGTDKPDVNARFNQLYEEFNGDEKKVYKKLVEEGY